MMTTLLKYISYFFVLMGNFFMISAIVGLIRNKDFYVKLHTISMFNIYGANFILFAIGILSYKPIIFFEMIFVIIINTLITLTVVNCLFRNAILNGIQYKAKTRDDVTAEETAQMKEQREIHKHDEETERIKREKKEQERKEKEEQKLKEKEEKERLKREKEEKKQHEKEEKEKEKEKLKQEKEKSKEVDKSVKQTTIAKPVTDSTISTTSQPSSVTSNSTTQSTSTQTTTTSTHFADKLSAKKSGTKPAETKPVEKPKVEYDYKNDTRTTEEIEKENEELRKKIKEQKKILRKKIETVRRNAFITRKPEEIQKAEDTINEILTKYNLTEDMLKDDDE